jgi:hypothetical protein
MSRAHQTKRQSDITTSRSGLPNVFGHSTERCSTDTAERTCWALDGPPLHQSASRDPLGRFFAVFVIGNIRFVDPSLSRDRDTGSPMRHKVHQSASEFNVSARVIRRTKCAEITRPSEDFQRGSPNDRAISSVCRTDWTDAIGKRREKRTGPAVPSAPTWHRSMRVGCDHFPELTRAISNAGCLFVGPMAKSIPNFVRADVCSPMNFVISPADFSMWFWRGQVPSSGRRILGRRTTAARKW